MAIDLILKIKEHLKDKQVYPKSILVYQRKNMVWSHDKDALRSNTFKKTSKMVPYESFQEDPNCLIEHLKTIFKENEGALPFPARMLGATANNFKPVHEVRLPSKKIDNIFKKA